MAMDGRRAARDGRSRRSRRSQRDRGRKVRVPLAESGTVVVALLSIVGLVLGPSTAAAAATGDASTSSATFLSGSLLLDAVALDSVAALDGVESSNAGSPSADTDTGGLDVTVLNTTTVSIPGGPTLGTLPTVLQVGLANQYSQASDDGVSRAASGAVSDTGVVDTGGSGGFPSGATLTLTPLLGAAPFTGALDHLRVEVSAITGVAALDAAAGVAPSSTCTDLSAPTNCRDYNLAAAKIVGRSPAIDDVVGSLTGPTSVAQAADDAIAALAGSNGSLAGVIAGLDPAFATLLGDPSTSVVITSNHRTALEALLDTPVTDGVVTVNLRTGVVEADLDALLLAVTGKGVNDLPPSTQLVSTALLTELDTRVTTLLNGVVTSASTTLQTSLNAAQLAINVQKCVVGDPPNCVTPTVDIGTGLTLVLNTSLADLVAGSSTIIVSAKVAGAPLVLSDSAVLTALAAPVTASLFASSSGVVDTATAALTVDVNAIITTIDPALATISSILSLVANVQEAGATTGSYRAVALRATVGDLVGSGGVATVDLGRATVGPNTTVILDTDGDGILDSVEGTVDDDGDGVVNSNDLDSDNDGVADAVEGATDADSDGTADYRDLDADDDGLPDTVEAGGSDANGDGVIDGFDDGNGDGWNDTTATANLPDHDTDGDSAPDRLDVDADADTIPDRVEGGYPTAPFTAGAPGNPSALVDTDDDGLPDHRDRDADGDSLPDSVEAGPDPTNPVDTDGDGKPDYRDTDSDNDTIPDATESTVDTDGDGTPDYRDADSDNDTIPDETEGNTDSDRDGTPDRHETDSDNDTIPDRTEAGPDPKRPLDTDGDGKPDFQDTDSDADGTPDRTEAGADPTEPVDTDGDGKPDYRDTDADSDGIPDSDEEPGDIDDDGIQEVTDFNPIVVWGVARDDKGRILRTIPVTMTDSAGNVYRTTTDANGEYRFQSAPGRPIAPGRVVLSSPLTNSALGEVTAAYGQTINQDLELPSDDVPATLAFTGASTSWLFGTGLAMIAVGFALVHRDRRPIRRPDPHPAPPVTRWRQRKAGQGWPGILPANWPTSGNVLLGCVITSLEGLGDVRASPLLTLLMHRPRWCIPCPSPPGPKQQVEGERIHGSFTEQIALDSSRSRRVQSASGSMHAWVRRCIVWRNKRES